MKKIEFIWREVLASSLEERKNRFSQKALAQKFRLSTSTVFQALKKPRLSGTIKVGSRNFELMDFEKLLFIWATERKLSSEISYQTYCDLPILEIEGLMPAEVIPTAYTAYRFLFQETPADYDQVYFYAENDITVKERFPSSKKEPNIFILKADPYLSQYQPAPPLAQVFVDLWNLPSWYAKEYQNALLVKIKERLNL